MEQTGTLIACSIAPDNVRSMKLEKGQAPEPLIVLFATILKPEDINVLFEIPDHQIHQVMPDLSVQCLGSASPEPVVADHTPEPEAAVQPEPTPAVDTDPVAPAAPAEIPPPVEPKTTVKKTETETSLRVHVSLLDQLMTLAGELVLSRNQLLQSMTSEDHRGSEIAGQRIDLITSELQEAIMLTRMQSIGNVFNKFPRVVRDLSQTLEKKVDLHLEGKDVELDKTIIEAIGDEPSPEMVLMMQESVEQLFSHLGVGQLRDLAGAKLEGYSNADLAQRFGCSERTIERRLHLIREKCQRELVDLNVHPSEKTTDCSPGTD